MAVCRSKEDKQGFSIRLKRMEGQLRGIEKMIENDGECIDVLRQIASVSGALHGLWVKILEGHLKGCIRQALVERDDSLVDELVEHLKKVK